MSETFTAVGHPRGARVLVVDDSPFARRMISLLLESAGFVVVGHAADGVEALNKVAELVPDLVTLDVNMPSLDGFSVLAQLRQTSRVPVVLVTALPMVHVEENHDLNEPIQHVPVVGKTVSKNSLDISMFREELIGAVSRALAGSN